MSLSGNLGFVSLDEVLRLLTRSSQQGSVDVRGEQIRGRIFITKGGIGLATTSDDEGLHRHLVKSGLVDDAYLNDVEKGASDLAPFVEKSDGAIVELIREMTVESIYQLGLNGESFEVYEGAKSTYVSPKAFELEELLTDSKQRLTDWVEVSRIVKDLGAPVAFVRDLGDREEVKIDNASWKVLSEVGSGASVSQMADELGTTEFWTARIASRLIDKDLVSFIAEEVPVDVPVADTEVFESIDPDEVSETPVADKGAVEQAGDVETQSNQVDPEESWWEEPEADAEEDVSDVSDADVEEVATGSRSLQEMLLATEASSSDDDVDENESDDVDESAKEQAAAATSQIPTLSTNGDTAEVEEDTEAFLEKVFSELETPEEPEEPEEEGYGLLRRRRMGAIRDLSSDS